MICASCREAGEFTTVAGHPGMRSAITDRLILQAKQLHSQCPGAKPVKASSKAERAALEAQARTWCDCQHSLEPSLNLALIEAEKQVLSTPDP